MGLVSDDVDVVVESKDALFGRESLILAHACLLVDDLSVEVRLFNMVSID